MSENVTSIDDSTFAETVLEAELPVLVDFWAPWCGPCRIIGPVVEELANEYAGKLTVAKMNTDENGETPVNYGIRGIPTLIFFSEGEEWDRLVGAVPKAALVEKIDQLLAWAEAG